MNRWSQSDPYEAGVWLGTLPSGESRDAAVISYTRRVVASDPQAAAQWAETIANQNVRDRQIETIVVSWLRSDANRAAAWLSNSSLPPETKARLLSQK